MARKYSRSASKDVEGAMRKGKRVTLKRGKSGKGGKVKSRKQAIAIDRSEARKNERLFSRRAAAMRSWRNMPGSILRFASISTSLCGK
jgi:hypothetical protein